MTYKPFYGPDIWKPVPSADGYEASDLGNVRSVDRTITLSNGNTRRVRGRMLSPGVGSNPQDRAHVCLGRGDTRNVHSLVAEAFYGARPGKMDVCHENGDRHDNRAGNLRYDTHSNNQKQMVEHGTCHTSNRTNCPRGHPLVPPNLTEGKRRAGRRSCKACSRATAYIKYHDLPVEKLQEISDRYFIALWKDNT